MSLSAGSRVGPYEITAALGAGGMGEVYRARDTRLGRDVALKVLPAAFAQDAERLARFRREAHLLAALNDAHIAAIHGLEEIDGVVALALELAPGEDLAQRLNRGPIPVDEALAIARQIAEGLEAAHEQGIVHRDLKPANIKVTPDGKVKILDFGLAKAWEGDAAAAAEVSHSPTVTRETAAGVILGTAAYMSPEQARGKPVDKRADIWSFGVVLYEMLTGKQLFAGETVSDTLAAVLTRDPDWKRLPAGTPFAVRDALRRCLDREVHRRLHDVADVRIVLDEALAGRLDERESASAPGTASRRAVLPWIVAAAAMALAVAGWIRPTGAPVAGPITFERLTFRPGHFVNARFARDGQTIFLGARWDAQPLGLFQLRPGAGELSLGVVGADLLSVSRTGELAVLLPRIEFGNPYVQVGTLAVVSASGGTPREVAEDVAGADWAPDGDGLAVHRLAAGKNRLELPLGTILYESARSIACMRFSPTGDGLAFFELEAGELWSVVLVHRSGVREVLSTGWGDWYNLAFSPDGKEVWFGAAKSGSAARLYSVDRGRHLRTLHPAAGALELHDIAADRSALVALVNTRGHAFGGRAAADRERALSWLEISYAVDISADGRQVLLFVFSERDPDGPGVFLRTTDGAAPVRLGTGRAQELSRDGKWALAVRGRAIVAMPTGAGQARIRETPFSAISAARWMPDGARVLVAGRLPGGRSAAALVSFAGGPPEEMATPFDVRSSIRANAPLSPVSPDGRFVAAAMAGGGITILPLDGGAARPLPHALPNEFPAQWLAGGRELLVLDVAGIPAHVHKVDVRTGRRDLWRALEPADRVGVSGIARLAVTPDAAAYAYSYLEYRSDLYLVKGLR